MANAATYQSGTVGMINVGQVGTEYYVYVQLRDTNGDLLIHNEGCQWGNTFVYLNSTANANQMMSVLLAAYMSEKEVTLGTNGCLAEGSGSRPKIEGVRLGIWL